MKRIVKYASIILLVIAALFLFGPRPDNSINITFNPEVLGSDLDAYLEKQERQYSDITPGAEKEIIWFDPATKAQTEISVVYIHGFSATQKEIRPVPEIVSQNLNANLYFARLEGHGQSSDAFGAMTLNGWANDFAEAMEIGRQIGKRVLVISTSTGSTLSTWGATQPELIKDVAGFAMLSPNFETQGLPNSVGNMPWAETILPLVAGPERSWEPYNEEQGKWWTTRYPTKALFPMFALLGLVEQIDVSGLEQPIFIAYSEKDQVIIPEKIESIAEQWGGPVEIIKIDGGNDPSHHVLAGDIMGPENSKPLADAIAAWAAKL